MTSGAEKFAAGMKKKIEYEVELAKAHPEYEPASRFMEGWKPPGEAAPVTQMVEDAPSYEYHPNADIDSLMLEEGRLKTLFDDIAQAVYPAEGEDWPDWTAPLIERQKERITRIKAKEAYGLGVPDLPEGYVPPYLREEFPVGYIVHTEDFDEFREETLLDIAKQLEDIVKKLKGFTIDEIYPIQDVQDYSTAVGGVDVGELGEILAEALAEVPRPKPIAMHLLTTEQIFAALSKRYAPEIPEMIEGEDLYDILSSLGYDEEGIPEEMDYIEGLAEDRVKAWEEWQSMLEQYEAGLHEMTKSIPWSKRLEYFVFSSFSALGKAIDPYFHYVSRPIAGHAILAVQGLMPGEQGYERLFHEALREDNFWEAAGKAYEDWGMNWGVKLLIEMGVDPLTYFGIGIYTRATRGVPILGRAVGGAEMGFLRVADKPFQAFKAGWAKLPKTATLIAKMRAQSITSKSLALIRSALRKPIRQISYEEGRNVLTDIVKLNRAYPNLQGDAGVVGGHLLEMHTGFVTREEIIAWGRKLGVNIPADSVTTQNITDATRILSSTYGAPGASVLTQEEGAARILGILKMHGVSDSQKNLQNLVDLILARNEAAFNMTMRTLEAGSLKELSGKIYNRAYSDFVGNRTMGIAAKAESEVFKQEFRIGITASMLGKFERSFLNSARLQLDRHLTMPFARAYLMFMNYGMPNVFESWFKGGFGKAGWRVRVGASQIDMLQDIWGHLPNIPYDLATFKARRGWTAIKEIDPSHLRLEIMATSEGRESLMMRLVSPNWLGDMPGVGQMIKKIPFAGQHIAKIPVGKLMIEPWGEMSMQRYAYCIRNWMKHNMFDESTVPAEIQSILKGMVRPDIKDKKLLQALDDALFESLLSDPEMARALPSLFTADRIAAGEMRTVFEPFLAVEQFYKDIWLANAQSGALWARGGAAIDDMAEYTAKMMQEAYLHSPEVVSVKYHALADAVKSQGIDSYESWTRAMQTLDVMTDNFNRDITLFRSIATKEGRSIRELAAKDLFHDDMQTRLVTMIDENREAMDSIRNIIIRDMEIAGLSSEDVVRAHAALDKFKGEWEAVGRARVEQFTGHDALKAEWGAAKRTDEFWSRWYDIDEAAWGNVQLFRRGNQAELESLVDQLGKVKYPKPIDTAGRDLVAGDIAHLWNTLPDNIRIGFFDMSKGTISMTKDEFIYATQRRAERVCLGLDRAEAMGYTAERIEAVYDNLLLSMKIDPTQPIPELAPRLMELESMKDAAWRIYHTKGIPEQTLKQVSDYIDDVIRRVEDIPGYLAPEVPARVAAKVPSSDVFWRQKVTWLKQGDVIEGKLCVRVGGEHYLILPETEAALAGFEGRIFVIEFTSGPNAGKVVSTTNLWHQGSIPKKFSPELPDNARWVGETPKVVDVVPETLEAIRKLPPPPKVPVTRALSDDYKAAQFRAMETARSTYGRTFADYDPAGMNALDDIVRSIMPYWPYEIHRPMWLLTNCLKYPALPLSLSRFNNYTDRGYVHVPGTSIEVNPFRGTIFGPVITRLTMRDFPEYYDTFPWLSQTQDILSQYGFYAGFPFQLANTLWGYKSSNVRPQFGMLLPAWMKTPMNALIATMPTGVGDFLKDTLFPDYFRDYLTILAVNKRVSRNMDELGEYDGVNINDKRRMGIPLDPQEEALWESASREIAMWGIAFEQVAVFRYRTEEQIEAWEAASEVIEERMHIPLEKQEELRQMGLRISDYYIPIDPETQRILNDMEAVKLWAGVTIPLQPSTVQAEMALRRLFWDEVDRKTKDYEQQQAVVDDRFLMGMIRAGDWRRQTSGLVSERVKYIDTLHKSDMFKNIPVTLEELKAYYDEHGRSTPTFHPERELFDIYYTIKPEEVWDDDSGTWMTDWNKYYALIDALLNELPEDLKAQFIKDITARMSPMRQLQWHINRGYIRPYRNTFMLGLLLYSPEEQKVIREWYRTASKERREELEEKLTEDGRKTVSSFRTTTRDMRQNLRLLDPALDAWLYFFGYTTTFKTVEGEEAYYRLCMQYGKVR